MPQKDEYEVLSYPRLNHVRISVAQIGYRNPHIHRALEICLVLEGSADVWVQDHAFHATEGSLLMFNSGEPHEISATSASGVSIAYIQIANHFCRDYIRPLRNLELLVNDADPNFSTEQKNRLTAQIIRTIRSYFDGENDRLQLLSDVCTLLRLLLKYAPHRYLDEAAYLAHGKKLARIQRITEYMDTHCTEHISLEEIAKQEQITTTYLSHFIRDNLNMSFQQYLNTLRFEKALKLIQTTDMCLSDVSLASGFSDPKYMKRMFFERFGCNPGTYRQTVATQKTDASAPADSREVTDAALCMARLEAFLQRNKQFAQE